MSTCGLSASPFSLAMQFNNTVERIWILKSVLNPNIGFAIKHHVILNRYFYLSYPQFLHHSRNNKISESV